MKGLAEHESSSLEITLAVDFRAALSILAGVSAAPIDFQCRQAHYGFTATNALSIWNAAEKTQISIVPTKFCPAL